MFVKHIMRVVCHNKMWLGKCFPLHQCVYDLVILYDQTDQRDF